jgi:hypothetical protein
MNYIAKERDVRTSKNKLFSKASLDFNKNEKRKITSELQKIYALINSSDRQIGKLEGEKRNLDQELRIINEFTLPEKNNSPSNEEGLNRYKIILSRSTDSIVLLRKALNSFSANYENVSYELLNDNFKAIDSAVRISCGLLYQKCGERIFFNWNLKIFVDTLQDHHKEISKIKDSIINFQSGLIREIAVNNQTQMNYSSLIRNFYREKLKRSYSMFASGNDSIIKSLNIKDSCEAIKAGWQKYNVQREAQIDNEIKRLKKEKNSLILLIWKLRFERSFNNFEMKFEGRRYRHFNGEYLGFSRREKRKAVRYTKNLTSLKKQIQLTESKCKEKVRKEQKEELEKAKNNKSN